MCARSRASSSSRRPRSWTDASSTRATRPELVAAVVVAGAGQVAGAVPLRDGGDGLHAAAEDHGRQPRQDHGHRSGERKREQEIGADAAHLLGVASQVPRDDGGREGKRRGGDAERRGKDLGPEADVHDASSSRSL